MPNDSQSQKESDYWIFEIALNIGLNIGSFLIKHWLISDQFIEHSYLNISSFSELANVNRLHTHVA